MSATEDSEIELAEMWSVSGQLLHTPAYRARHAGLLAAALGDRDAAVLDAACGTGFPLIELIGLGFRRLSGSDADPALLVRCRERLAADPRLRARQPRLIEASWQQLPDRIPETFANVLCVDAAIGFMDSWITGEMRQGPANIFARVTEVLRNFHAVTAPGGRFFIGLQKNNHKGNRFYPMKVGAMELDGITAEAHWHMTYDWERRIKTWRNIVRVGGREFTQTRHSYLFDLDELAGFLCDAGFARVARLPTPDDLYEDILVAHRAG